MFFNLDTFQTSILIYLRYEDCTDCSMKYCFNYKQKKGCDCTFSSILFLLSPYYKHKYYLFSCSFWTSITNPPSIFLGKVSDQLQQWKMAVEPPSSLELTGLGFKKHPFKQKAQINVNLPQLKCVYY